MEDNLSLTWSVHPRDGAKGGLALFPSNRVLIIQY